MHKRSAAQQRSAHRKQTRRRRRDRSKTLTNLANEAQCATGWRSENTTQCDEGGENGAQDGNNGATEEDGSAAAVAAIAVFVVFDPRMVRPDPSLTSMSEVLVDDFDVQFPVDKLIPHGQQADQVAVNGIGGGFGKQLQRQFDTHARVTLVVRVIC
jgi:hypothetical protein